MKLNRIVIVVLVELVLLYFMAWLRMDRVCEQQEIRIAELETELAVAQQRADDLETEVAMAREENVALLEELEYTRWVLEDPMALFTGPLIELTPDEERELKEIAMSEAGNQGIVGKALVMLTVLNRCEKSGQSIHDVIYAPSQYYTAGMREPDEEAEIALLMVSAGWDGSQGAVYFSNQGYNSCATIHLFRFGAHYFGK